MENNIKSYLSFKIASEYYAANVGYVHNIIEYTNITKVPHMPQYMLGIINLRGQVLPVVDSRIKFGIDNTKITSNTCILVMEIEIDEQKVFVGLLVDAVAEVLEIDQEEIKDPPNLGSNMKTDYMSGIYYDNEKFIMLLNMNKVFEIDEILNITELTKEKA